MVLGLFWILKMTNKVAKPLKAKKFHSLSRRIVAQFCMLTIIISGVFSFLSFLLLYTLEDAFIDREVKQEANGLIAHYEKNNEWPEVKSAHMALYFSKASLPGEMREQFLEQPNEHEFYGEQGRHYHLYQMPNHDEVYLLAEVSKRLLVRPVRDGVLTLLSISALFLTSIAFVIAWVIGRKTAKPLKELADLVDGVAPENIPNTFADKYPNNEIGVLARTLENSMQQISNALEREKCFTRDVSHELRTPVAVIKNAVELYHEKVPANGQGEEVVNRIKDASIQMEQTVTTLLHLAREEHADAKKAPVKLLPIIEQSIISHGYLLDDKQVEVEVSDSCNATVVVQKGMLKVLLDNLLSNAFQYTEMGMVKVSFTGNTLTIEDTGPGIEQGISEDVTKPAVKGSQSTGYGFGLSIVKRLCEHQQWKLDVVSQHGTSISVSFA